MDARDNGPAVPHYLDTPGGLLRIGVAWFGAPGQPSLAETDRSALSEHDLAALDAFFAEHGDRWRIVRRVVDGAEAAVAISAYA